MQKKILIDTINQKVFKKNNKKAFECRVSGEHGVASECRSSGSFGGHVVKVMNRMEEGKF